MDRNKIITLYNTIKFLKPVQIYYRLYYFVRNRLSKKDYDKRLVEKPIGLKWEDEVLNRKSFLGENSFKFLNVSKSFEEKIDWNYASFGKLWTYNLNYFDFLNQEGISKEDGLSLITNYIKNDKNLLDGKEPYTVSLRGINWIKFLSKNSIKEEVVNQTLYNHYQFLINNLEYHLLGNHLLENGFSLFFGAYYFNDKSFYKKAKKILKEQLEEQILGDGAHFELSPMYHQILLNKLLDCIRLVQLNNSWNNEEELKTFLIDKASKMLSWLDTITYTNGNIPMVNDSAFDIAPTSIELFRYAKKTGISWNQTRLNESGYRKFQTEELEVFMDVGDIKPSYQPGHAHSDTFSFELYNKNKPIIVDPGVSTYEKNQLRQEERGTYYHNTVQLADLEQTEVWGGFRVGKRARIFDLKEEDGLISAKHDGYKKNGIIHERTFQINEETLLIYDNVLGNSTLNKKFILHFHPDVEYKKISDKEYYLNHLRLTIDGDIKRAEEKNYYYCLGFNKTVIGKKIVIIFEEKLKVAIAK
ncbi:alginate lyase family protein [uncultured Tenacibaculum sp.]|uniref:alginate lyase family protein n=1 Tax=uncultured Tenacibaculum sp. TaxID=174713 RepID=UPI002607DD72|nr:alginate lyase family protein [uncultured Tenacibaculum sp.]